MRAVMPQSPRFFIAHAPGMTGAARDSQEAALADLVAAGFDPSAMQSMGSPHGALFDDERGLTIEVSYDIADQGDVAEPDPVEAPPAEPVRPVDYADGLVETIFHEPTPPFP